MKQPWTNVGNPGHNECSDGIPTAQAIVSAHPNLIMPASAHNVTHNAGSQLSRNSPNSRPLPLDVVFGKVHKYNILWLASLTNDYEFHLYYDI